MNIAIVTLIIAGWLGVQSEIFACPMHPDVQSPKSGTCQKCGMALLRRSSDPAAPEYLMTVAPRWASSGKSARLTFRFQRPDGRPAEPFQLVHERELHLFVVSRDLASFQHVHPSRAGAAEYAIDVSFPVPGEYMLLADFVPDTAAPQMLQQLLVTPGFPGRMGPGSPKPGLEDRVAQGVRFSLTAEEFRAATPTLLTFMLTDAETGEPVRNLEPYLGAAGHLFFADGDFEDASHSHPLERGAGPSIRFLTRFNAAGLHRIWLQVQRNGRLITVDWTLDVPEAHK